MKIASVRLYRYDLPLARPLPIKGQQPTHRAGLVMQCASNDGAVGHGDIAPLPTFSGEDLPTASLQAITAGQWLTDQPVPEGLERLDGGFDAWLHDLSLAPSVRSGVELALLNMLAQAREAPLRRVLCGRPLNRISVNGLLSGTPEVIVEKATEFRNKGYKTVKLKVGRGEIADDIALTRKVRDALGDGIALRLDANRAWDDAAAHTFSRGVSECGVEYIEEPIRDLAGIGAFARASAIPVALDETVLDLSPDQVRALPGIKALVLKPTFIGGFETAMRFGRAAQDAGITPVVSSAFESSVGLIGLANLAGCIHGENCAAGLDTASWLASDVLDTPVPVSDAEWDLGVLDRSALQLNVARLQEVRHC